MSHRLIQTMTIAEAPFLTYILRIVNVAIIAWNESKNPHHFSWQVTDVDKLLFEMPGGKILFKKVWLDGEGYKISSWCQPSQEVGKALCFIGKKTFLCNNQGLPQLLQHARGQSHKTLTNEILGGSQMVFASTHSTDAGKICGNSASNAAFVSKQLETHAGKKESSGTLQCISLKDEATRAELLWAMKVVSSHYSYASCDKIKDTLDTMFPGKIPDNFTMSSSKVSYLVSSAQSQVSVHHLHT